MSVRLIAVRNDSSQGNIVERTELGGIIWRQLNYSLFWLYDLKEYAYNPNDMDRQIHNSTLDEEAKLQINNLVYHPQFLDSSSFAQSKNGLNRFLNHNSRLEQSGHPHNHLYFPVVNAPTLQFTADSKSQGIIKSDESYCNADSEAAEEEPVRSDGPLTIKYLLQENRKLRETHNILQQKIIKLEKNKMLDTFGVGPDKKPNELRKLMDQNKEKDKKNIELHRQNKALQEELRALKEELEKKGKALATKTLELKRQHEKYEQAISRIKTIDTNQLHSVRTSTDNNQLKSRESEIKKLRNDLATISNNLVKFKEQNTILKQEMEKHNEQSRRLKIYNRDLSEKLKQEASKSSSIRNSTVSNSSLMDSFSPEMLSPQQTIDLIYEVFRRVAKSHRMARILTENQEFVNLLEQFMGDRCRRKVDAASTR